MKLDLPFAKAATACVLLLFGACGSDGGGGCNTGPGWRPDAGRDASTDAAPWPPPPPAAPPTYCVAIRGGGEWVDGNGERVEAHMAALSRMVEHFGMPTGGAGGGSASVSLFLLASVRSNRRSHLCPDLRCSDEQLRNRDALLLKSTSEYLNILREHGEGLAFESHSKVSRRISEAGIAVLLENAPVAGVSALREVLDTADLAEVVNPELRLLLDGENAVFHARDIVGSLTGAAPASDDHLMFIRPALINYATLFENIGEMGSFYAAYEPIDNGLFATWLDSCADRSAGLPWSEITALPMEESTCGERLRELIVDFRSNFSVDDYSRADDPVGLGLGAAITSTVLEGEAISVWENARQDYLRGRTPSLEIDFDHIRIGYFGADPELSPALENPRSYEDLKTSLAVDLGTHTWQDALIYASAEPGMSRGLVMGDGRISLGGWLDLEPTLFLRNMDCEKVIYLTREGGESLFSRTAANLLGASEEERSGLWDLGNAESSAFLSVAEADGVWCTSWDSFNDDSQRQELISDAYNAPFETIDSFFIDVENRYPNLAPAGARPGCSLGVTEVQPP